MTRANPHPMGSAEQAAAIIEDEERRRRESAGQYADRVGGFIQKNVRAFDKTYGEMNGFLQPAYPGQRFTGPGGVILVAVPTKPTPEMVAEVVQKADRPEAGDFDIAGEAVKLVPPTDHPDIGDILADVARDFRNMVAAVKA